jgi:hypothetical protein
MGTRYHFGWAVTFRFVPGVGRSGYARRGADRLRKRDIRLRMLMLTQTRTDLATSILGRI